MKITTIKNIRKEVVIDLPIELQTGVHYLMMKASGGYLTYFKVKVTEKTIEYVFCEPRNKKIVRKFILNVEHLFSDMGQYNINTVGSVYICNLKGFEYEEVEMLNYILSFHFQGVKKVSSREYEKTIKEITKLI